MWLFTAISAILLVSTISSNEVSLNTSTLGRLFADYDKDVRPSKGIEPLLVEVDLYVESFANIAEADMEYTLFGYLRHYWTDKRFAGKDQEPILLMGSTLENAWMPDTYISNSRESNLRLKDSEAQSSLLISPDGLLFYSKGVKIVASCDMRLEDFPMDTQQCELILSSYGHTVKDVIYNWRRDEVVVEKKEIAQFDLKSVELNSSNASYITGNFSKLVIKFTFKRRMGYYLIQVYLPDSLVVAISWIVFWLEQDDMGGRVGLGITTILTIMFLLGSVNMSLPRVSYPKAIDWFLIGSFLMVFLVLVECIIVYILRPNKGGMNGISDRSTGSTGSTDLRLQSNDANEDVTANGIGREPFQALKKRQVVILEKVLSNSEPVIPKTSGFNSKTPFLSEKDVEEEVMEKYSTHAQSDKNFKAFRECLPFRIAEIIDNSCRFLFPLCFVMFNVLYWCHYLKE